MPVDVLERAFHRAHRTVAGTVTGSCRRRRRALGSCPSGLPVVRCLVADLELVADDDPGARAPRDIAPRPVDEHHHPVAEADEVHEVQAEPGQPAERSPHDEATRELGDGRPATDGGHDALVLVAERPGGRPPSRRRIWRAAWRPDWMATWASCGQVRSESGRDPRGRRPRHPLRRHWAWPGRDEVGLDDEPARLGPVGVSEAIGHRALHGHAAGPNHGPGRDLLAVLELHVRVGDGLDHAAELELDVAAGQGVAPRSRQPTA